ncbi:hypothetical protein MLD38_016280 [Melastoma candidum]|uniref:Uncharacterized protein n=1 Tax=Melastoma candidum TaxID=119954 RepID=A0ACB9RI65_9MYRT|nr:hypothetical protein MLD38_016280 [Melastoma candidum]
MWQFHLVLVAREENPNLPSPPILGFDLLRNLRDLGDVTSIKCCEVVNKSELGPSGQISGSEAARTSPNRS